NTRPQLAGDEQTPLRRVVGDAVQNRALLQFVHRAEKPGQVDPSNHSAGLWRDPRNAIRLPYVCQNLAFYELELVEGADRRAVVADLHAPFFSERAPIEHADLGGAVAHEQIRPIRGQTPTFAGIGKATQQMKVACVVNESDLRPPGKLNDLVLEQRDSL